MGPEMAAEGKTRGRGGSNVGKRDFKRSRSIRHLPIVRREFERLTPGSQKFDRRQMKRIKRADLTRKGLKRSRQYGRR